MDIVRKVWSKNLKTSSISTHETQYNNIKGYQVNITRIDTLWRSHNQIIICTMKYWTNTHSWRLRKHITCPTSNKLYNGSIRRIKIINMRWVKFTKLSWSRNVDFVLVIISVQFLLDLLNTVRDPLIVFGWLVLTCMPCLGLIWLWTWQIFVSIAVIGLFTIDHDIGHIFHL